MPDPGNLLACFDSPYRGFFGGNPADRLGLWIGADRESDPDGWGDNCLHRGSRHVCLRSGRASGRSLGRDRVHGHDIVAKSAVNRLDISPNLIRRTGAQGPTSGLRERR